MSNRRFTPEEKAYMLRIVSTVTANQMSILMRCKPNTAFVWARTNGVQFKPEHSKSRLGMKQPSPRRMPGRVDRMMELAERLRA